MTAMHTPNAKIQLKSDHAENWALEKGRTTRVKAKAGSHYRVMVNADGKESDATEVSASRHADDLHIDVLGDTKVVLENFYGECRNAACVVELAGDQPAGYAISGDSPVGAAMGDGGGLVYAYGETNPLVQTLGVSENLAGFSTQAGMSTYIPPESHAAVLPHAWAIGGGIAMAAISGIAAAGTPVYTITVTAVAGKFNAADQVNIYDKDGNFLAQGQLNPSTGQYAVTITNGYRGAILVKVLDSNGNATNFNDEATGTDRSLNTELRAMAMADGSANVAVTVSPLTELAARTAGLTGNLVTEANLLTNQKIGRLFGVADITGPSVTVVDSGYNEGNGISAAEQYGKALAALSGADSVTGSVDATLTRLQDALVSNPADPSQLAIKQAGVDLIDAGTSAFEAGANAGSAALNIQNSQSAPWVVSASDGLNTTTEAGAGTSIKTAIGGATAGTVVHVVWGTQSFDYTLTANDVSAGVATIPVSASVISAAGDGDIAITTQVGSSAVSPAVIIVVDTSAPTALPDLSATTDTGVSSTDNVTQNATPIFNIGQLPAGVDSVQLLVNGQVVAATFNSANGELSPTSALSDGVSAISYRYVRGTFTGAASPSLSVTIDSAAPAAPSITGVSDNVAPLTGAVADNGASNDNTPTISGTAEANATVTLYQGNTVIGSTTADASGNWAYTPATPIADGSYSLVAKAVDAAGNESPASSARVFTIDTVVPAAPLAAPDLTTASDTGNPTDNITSDTTPSLAIAAPASGETVKLYVNGVAVAATYANGEVTPVVALGDGVKTLTYSYVDTAGNEGPQSPALAVTIDTSAATVPVANPSGGRLFTGTSEPGSTVTLSWNDGTPQTTTVISDANGNWRYPPTGLLSTGLPNGTLITVTATDVAGNPAPSSGSVVVDTLPPTLDSVQDDAGRITGSVANNASTDDATPTLSGTTGTAGSNGDVLKVFNGTTYLGDAIVNSGNGTWSFTPATPLAEGPANLSVKWISAGNTVVNSGGSSVFSLTVDTTAPGAPVNAPDLVASSDTGNSNSDNITSTNRPTLNLGSGLVAGDVVQLVVYVNGTETAGTYNPTTGDFIPDAPLAEGTHSIAFKIADAAGNLSAASPALTLTIDTTAPTAPASAPDLTTASDTGTSSTDDLTGDKTPAFQIGALPTGTAGVKLYVDGVEVSAQYDAATGEVTPSAALGDGTKAITYKYVDAAGNLSAASPALSITVDTTAPQMPATAPDLTNASDTGASSTDNITNDATPGFAITPPANGDSVKLYVDGVEVASTLVNGELTPVGALGDGPHAITYRYIDAAGNAGPASAGLNITIDTAVPVSPAANPSGGRLLTGVAEPGDTVTLSWTPAGGTPQTATVIANANGSWRYPDAGAPAINLPDGTAVTVTAADPAGNPAPGSATVTVSIAGPTIDSLTDDVARVLGTVARGGSTNDTQPTLTGTVGTNTGGIAGDYLRIFNGSTYLGDAVVDTVNGTWSFTPATALTEGNHALTAQWVTGGTANTNNGANASNGASSAFNFTVDTTAPAAPAAPDLLAASDTGASATDDNTTDNTPGFAVAAPASGESIKLYVDGVEVASVYDAANGTLTPTLPLGDGVHAISYGYVDAAGNVGAKSPALAVTIDTTAPAAPAAPDLIATSDTGSSATDDKTADNTPSFSVAAPAAGASIQMFVDGVQVAATYDAATGTLTPNAALADGVHAITYRTTDAAGNAGAQSPALSVTIDTTAPSAPLNAPDLTAASDTGISQTDDVTRSTTPSFAIGTLPAGVALVKLYVDGVAVAATYDAGTGAITPTAALTAGSKSITYAVVDSAGNESAPSAPLAITIDTTGPSIDPTANTSSGRAFTGSAGPGDAVTLTWTEGGLAKTATVLANANGNWTYSPATQVPNATVVTVTATDPAGNPAPHTAAVTVDINAPTLDSVVDNVALQTGEVANGGLTNDATLTLSGMTGSASGNYLRVFDGSTYLGDAVVDSVTGTWSFTTPALAQASHNLQVKWVSGGTAGTNDGTPTSNGASSVRSLTVDTTSPATPASAPDLIDAHDSGANTSDNITNVTQPTLNLGAGLIAGEVTAVEVTIDGVAITGTYDTATGNFAMAQPLAAGGHTVSFKLIDAAGNTSASSPTLTLTIDTTAPAAPAITGVSDDVAPVTGAVANAGPTNDTTPTIAGTAEANATVTLYNGSTLLGTTTADANGAWTYTPTTALSEGAYSITAKATDAAGNQSAASTARSFTVDTTAPATPAAAPDLTAASDTGSSSTDDTTNDTTPSFAIGQLPADASTVKLLVDGVEVAATYNASTGEVTPNSPLADGAKSITYQYVDTAGNISASSPALSITIDATTPAAPVIANVTDDAAPVTGTVANAGRTNDTTPTIAGTAEANATVALYNGSTLMGTTTADANGAWTYTPTTALAEGAYAITAKATDAAGNESAASAAQSFTIDTTAPTLSSSSPVDNAASVTASNNIVLTFNETVAAGSGNIVLSNGTDTRTISITDTSQVTISGTTITINPANDLEGGTSYNVQIASGVIRDAAGNAYAGIATSTALNFGVAVPSIDLGSIASGNGGLVINGAAFNDNSGYSVSAVGDLNADGLNDLIIGAPVAANRAYVVFGTTGNGPIELSAVALGSGGFVINDGLSTPGLANFTGGSVAGAGDVNGDGIADLVVGAPGGSSGNTYVVFGQTGTTPVELSAVAAGSGGFVIHGGTVQGEQNGRSVSGAGDVNGDGLADVILASPNRGSNGTSYVVYGKTSTTAVEVSALDAGSGGFGIAPFQAYSVSGAGDVNGDGFADLLVGAQAAGNGNNGQALVVFGNSTGATPNVSSVIAGSGGGFVVEGMCFLDYTGSSVANAGDVNGDGLADLIVGAKDADPNNINGAGRAFVVFGKTGSAAVQLSAVAAGTGGFVINGESGGNMIGFTVSSAGDVNGDGLADLLVASPYAGSANVNRGRTYVVFGGTATAAVNLTNIAAGSGGFAINGQCNGDQSGYNVSAAGDVNGDGLADLLVGGIYGDPTGRNDAGKTYVIFGSTGGAFNQTAVDVVGTTGDDTVSDGGTAKTLVSGAGNDTLTATAASVLYGGAGNDSFEIDATMITALQSPLGSGGNVGQLSRIDGGTGIDTIALAGSGLTLNLRQVANQSAGNPDGGSRIDSVERINLTGTGNNTLTLDPADIRDMAGMNLFNAGNGWTGLGSTVAKHQLLVDGNAGDVLNASGTWNDAGTITVNGQTYAVYNDQASATQLLVDTDITRNINAVVDTAPTLSSSSPADNATGIAAGNNIVLTFSEAILAGTGNIVISNGTDTRTISITDTSQVTISGGTVTINPSTDLQAGTTYNVQMASGVLKDATGNNYAGISDATTLNFKIQPVLINAFQLSTIAAGSSGFTINGITAGASSQDLSLAGDINGDGLEDMLVSGTYINSTNIGRTYVVFGKTDTAAVDVTTVAAQTSGFVINGECNADYNGDSIASAGDINGDGLADLIIGARRYGSDAGRSYVVFGKTDTSPIDLSALGTNGFIMNGEGQQAGRVVTSLGDVNGDGLTDLMVNSAMNKPGGWSNEGRSYVVFGKTDSATINLSTISATAAGTGGFAIIGAVNGDIFANGSAAGDVNGDGLADILVGSAGQTPHVVFGQTGTNPISVSDLSTSGKGFNIQMEVANGSYIPSMTVAGDVNGDGLADLIIGVPVSNKAYVVFGKADTTTVNLSAIAATASGVGSGGFVINAWSDAPYLGQSVSSAGDVNGDGLTDLLIGTNADTLVGSAGFARAYVVYGKTDTVKVDLSNLVATGGGSIGFAIYGNPEVAGGRTHQVKNVSAAGDVNGDGLDDLIVGAVDDFSYIPGGVQMRTRQYVIFGGDQFATTVDYLGDATDNTLSGSASSETFVGGRGNDTLTGAGGADVIYGGAGNDVIVINADNAAKLVAGVTDGQLARIDGGTGIDTLRLGGTGIALNLAGIVNVGVGTPDGLSRVEDIEKIDLATGNSVSLTAKDVIDMAGMNVFNDSTVVLTSGTLGATVRQHQVWVDGDATDTLVLSRTDTWNTVGTIVSGGQTYNVMQNSSAAAQLIVDADIVVRKAMVMNISSEVQSDGALKLDEAADGTVVTVLIDQTGAVAGNTVKVNWGGQEVSQVLQAADISAGSVAITVSSSVLRAATAFGTSSPEIVSAGLYNGTTVLQNTANTNVSVDMRGIAAVELSSTGATVLVINGHTTNDNSGYSVSAAGDINGDGFEDLIIGAYKSDPGTTARTDAGRTYVVFGKNSIADPFPLYYVSSSAYGGFAINGQCTIDYSGNSVSAAGDVNGDGLADLIVGAYYRDPYGSNEGSSYVVFGKTTTTELELSTVAAGSGGGFAINGGASNEYLGTSVSAAGDVNGDGLADLIVGAPNSNTAAGHVYVIFGKTGSAAVNASALAAGSTDGFVINGQCANDQVGYSVSSAGDVNGDGLADVLIGAKSDASFAGGRSYVVFGKASTTAVDLSAVAGGTGGFVINAQCADQANGFTVSALGDVNGDGLSDLIVGAPYSPTAAGTRNGGRSYVVFGKSDNTSPVDLTAIAAGTGGFAIYGAVSSEWTGWSVSNAGDINGDGLTDMILGTSQSTPAGRTNAGRSYVVFGKANGTTVQISDILLGDGGFVINGQCAEDWSGRSVSAAGDLNGDGFDDLVIGAVQGDSAYGTNSGNSYVVFGGSQFATNVDFLGTSNNDALNGSSTTSNLSETFVAGRGNDTITGGGGADVMLGGGDNDIFVLNADNIAKLSAGITDSKLARVDGGTGLDTLRVMGGASLDLTTIANVGAGTPDGFSRIESIEKIDLATDTAANTLTLRVKDVIDMSGMNLFNVNTTAVDSFHQLMIKGDAGDTVNIGLSGWTATGTTYLDATDGNHSYKVYQDTAAHAQLLIDSAIVTASHVI